MTVMFDNSISADIDQGRFASVDEIIAGYPEVDYSKDEAMDSGVNIISDGIKARVFNTDDFSMVVGATGSRKTMTVVAPYILSNALAGNSMIISDVKGDLLRLLYNRLKGLGYRIRVLNYNDPMRGDTYNPLEGIEYKYKNGKKDEAMADLASFAETIFACVRSEKDRFWDISASQFFIGLCGLLCEFFEPGSTTIENVLNLYLQGECRFGASTYLQSFFEGRETSLLWKYLATTVTAPQETKKSITSVFSSCLNKYAQNESLLQQMSGSSFSIKELQEQKEVVFVVSNEQSLSIYGDLITSLLQQWYDELIRLADQNSGVLDRKVVFVLDEFGNIPAIKDFGTKISLSRARNISWMIVVQSLAQLSFRYGKNVASTIMANTSNLIYMFSPDLELLKYISELCGEIRNEATGQKRPLVSVNKLRHFNKEEGETLLILGRMNPFITYLPNITDYYGIEPLKDVKILCREERKLSHIDFKKIVTDYKKEQIRKEMRQEEEKRRAYRQRDESVIVAGFDKLIRQFKREVIGE